MTIFKEFNHMAREFYSGKTFIAFDTETTGLKASENSIIELGAVKFNWNGTIGEPFNMLIKPPADIPEMITQLTGISNEMVKDCPTAKDALPEFYDYIEGRDTILVAHNAPFDVGFVAAETERAGLSQLKNKVIDTLPLSRWAYPGLIRLPEKGQYKLQSLAKRFKVEVHAAHRACDDARVCMEIFKRILKDTMDMQKDVGNTPDLFM